LEVAQRLGQYEKASQLRFATIPDLQRQLPNTDEIKNKEMEDQEKLGGMLHDRVTSNDIARVVAKTTGIPVTNLLKGERDKLVHVRAFVGLLNDVSVPNNIAIDGRCTSATCRWSGPRSIGCQ